MLWRQWLSHFNQQNEGRNSSMKKNSFVSMIVLVQFTAAIIFAFSQFTLPQPLPVDAPADQFSAGRAIEALAPIASEPHPAGSPLLAVARGNLTEQLQLLGLEVEIQSTTGTLPRYNAAGHVDNIVARLPGTQSSGALLLMAHYDSVPQGPGSGDNGTGVVTILESLRALQSEFPLNNDIIVLLTDAEEYGTLGAQAFAAQHPWMDDVSVVFNIEGALKGSVVLVETGPQNGWFVNNFRAASPHTLGYSWLYDLFGLMPNLTDFMPFREAGLAGGNLFAFNGGSQYHTPRDTIENMDPRSLQQHGEQTLALVRHFSDVDLSEPHASDVVYFNIYKNWMVVYPTSWALPLAVVVSIMVFATMVWISRRYWMSVKKLLLGFLAALGSLVAGPTLVIIVWGVVRKIHPQYDLYFPAHTYNDGWYAAAFATLAGAVTVALFNLLRRKLEWRELLGGTLLLLGIINIPVSIFAPGFSYLFPWPLFFAILPLWILSSDEIEGSWKSGVVSILQILPSVFLWLPVGAVLYWSSGLDFIPAIALAVTLPLTLAVPLLEILRQSRQWVFPVVLVGGFLVGIIGGSLTSGFDAEHPMPLRVQYFLNADTGEAFWINPQGPLSEWQAQFTEESSEEVSWNEVFPPFHSTIVRSPAPVVDLSSPHVEVLGDFNKGNAHHLVLRIKPTRESDQIILAFPPGITVLSAQANGQPWIEIDWGNKPSPTAWQVFYYAALPEDGIDIVFAMALPGPDMFIVAERSVGLEFVPGLQVEPRPESILSLGDYVYVSQTIKLKPLNQ
jgi:hypothetical protein